MSYDVLEVCRHVINYSNEQDYGISNLKLQKVLYLIQAYFLIDKTKNASCFDDFPRCRNFYRNRAYAFCIPPATENRSSNLLCSSVSADFFCAFSFSGNRF